MYWLVGVGWLCATAGLYAHFSKPTCTRHDCPVVLEERTPHVWDVTSETPQVVSLNSYLRTLAFNKPLTLRGLLALLVSSSRLALPFRFVLMMVVGCLPGLGLITIATQPHELLAYIQRVLCLFSIGMYSSIADAIHHVLRLQPLGDGVDAITKLSKSDLCEPSIPHYDPMVSFARYLEAYPDEDQVVESTPLLPQLLPGFCLSEGGMKPLQTLRDSKRNLLVVEMLNRLTANVLVHAHQLDAEHLFHVTFKGQTLTSVHDFVTCVPGVSMWFSRNASSFGLTACVQGTGKDAEYQTIPIIWPSRIPLRDPDTGDQVMYLSYHSSLIIHGDRDLCPLGGFRVQFFLSHSGWTGWTTGQEMLKPWAPLQQTPPLNEDQVVKACQISTCVSCAVNLATKTQRLVSLNSHLE